MNLNDNLSISSNNLDEQSHDNLSIISNNLDKNIYISNRLKNKLYRPRVLHKLYLFLYLENDNPLYLESLEPIEISILNEQLNVVINLLFPTWNNLNVYLLNIGGELVPIIYFLEIEYLNMFYKLIKNKKIQITISSDIFEFGPITVKCMKDIIQRCLIFGNY